MNMKNLIHKWNNISLIKRIICGLIIGIALGLIFPQATAISILGDLFVGALRGIAPLLVFFLIMSSLCRMQKARNEHVFYRDTVSARQSVLCIICSYCQLLVPGNFDIFTEHEYSRISHHRPVSQKCWKSANECRCESSRLTGKRQLYRNPCMGHHTWHCS